MSETPAERALQDAMSGDVSAMTALERASQDDLIGFTEQRRCVLRRATVASVLRRYATGDISAAEAQRWASFMRFGYVPGGKGPVAPLEIEFEASNESAIVECLGRLEELGDLIDGKISAGEAAELLRALGEPLTART